MDAPGAAPPPPLPHGGRLRHARRCYPDAPAPLLDLSTGINPFAYVPPADAAADLARLPEPEDVAALEAEAAAAYGVRDPAMVVAAPGTQLLIGLAPLLWPARTVEIVGPTYQEHAAAWAGAGALVMPATEPAAIRPQPGGVAVVCNPNNPDGRCWPAAALLPLADRLAAAGGCLLVDEAFCDLEAAALSLAPCLPHAGIVVLRSFGKTYGLAGLRLGFALLAPARAARLRGVLGPWPVSAAAVRIGRAALADGAWRERTTGQLVAAGAALDRSLAAAGLRVIGGTRLFRLAEIDGGEAGAAAWADRLGKAGIVVRAFAEQPRWLRFGIPGGAADLARLRAALGLR